MEIEAVRYMAATHTLTHRCIYYTLIQRQIKLILKNEFDVCIRLCVCGFLPNNTQVQHTT